MTIFNWVQFSMISATKNCLKSPKMLLYQGAEPPPPPPQTLENP